MGARPKSTLTPQILPQTKQNGAAPLNSLPTYMRITERYWHYWHNVGVRLDLWCKFNVWPDVQKACLLGPPGILYKTLLYAWLMKCNGGSL